LPGIMKAKKKPLEETTLESLGAQASSRTRVIGLEAPPKRKAGVRVKSVEELVQRLRTDAKVL